MRPIDVLQAIAYPLTSATVLVPLLVFWILISFALWGGLLGAFLLFLVIPAVFRFQVIVLEARARGVEPETPGAEFFNWFGNAWTLFPVPLSVLLVWLVIATGQRFGETAAGVAVFLASTIFPASLAVLAITHSPLQSVNPVAITRLLAAAAAHFGLPLHSCPLRVDWLISSISYRRCSQPWRGSSCHFHFSRWSAA